MTFNPDAIRSEMLTEIAHLAPGARAAHEQHVAAVSDLAVAAGVDLNDPQQCRALMVGNFAHTALLIIPGLTDEEAIDRCGVAIARLWLEADVRVDHLDRLRDYLAEHPNATVAELTALAAEHEPDEP